MKEIILFAIIIKSVVFYLHDTLTNFKRRNQYSPTRAWKDSNLQRSEPESDTLSFELHAHSIKLVVKTTNFIEFFILSLYDLGFEKGH